MHCLNVVQGKYTMYWENLHAASTKMLLQKKKKRKRKIAKLKNVSNEMKIRNLKKNTFVRKILTVKSP